MCIHETIQLSQDGERVIVCGDCGREFAKLAEDDNESLVVPVPPGRSVVLLNGELGVEEMRRAGPAVAVTNRDGVFDSQPTYPCAECGWAASCAKYEGEPCHT